MLRPTSCIKNRRGHRLFKGFSPLQVFCILIGNRPQPPTFHTCTVSKNTKENSLRELLRENFTRIDVLILIYEKNSFYTLRSYKPNFM